MLVLVKFFKNLNNIRFLFIIIMVKRLMYIIRVNKKGLKYYVMFYIKFSCIMKQFICLRSQVIMSVIFFEMDIVKLGNIKGSKYRY